MAVRIPKALLPHKGVTIEDYLGKTGRGERWAPERPLAPRVLVVAKRRMVKNAGGDVVMSTAQVYMPGDPGTTLPEFESKVTIYPRSAWKRTARVVAYDLYDAENTLPGTITLFLE